MKKTIYRIANYFLSKQWVLSIVMLFLSDDKKEKIHIAKLRAELSFWGHDTSDMTDEEIKEGTKAVAEMMIKFGFTADELLSAITGFKQSNKK